MQLQHKLSQALENVRKAESTRENLKVALSMNASLQSKLDEVKAKYAAVQASRSSSTSSSWSSSSTVLHRMQQQQQQHLTHRQ